MTGTPWGSFEVRSVPSIDPVTLIGATLVALTLGNAQKGLQWLSEASGCRCEGLKTRLGYLVGEVQTLLDGFGTLPEHWED